MGKLIRKATGLTVGVATLLAGLVLPMTASAESASPIDASPIIHYSFDNALTSKTIANEGSAANSDATLSGDATVANGQINLTGFEGILEVDGGVSDSAECHRRGQPVQLFHQRR